MFSSQGIVSSIMRVLLSTADHITMSGWRVVVTISFRKTSCLLKCANFCHSLPGLRMARSCAGALRVSHSLSHFASTMHLSSSANLEQTWVSATLHPERMCWRLALMLPQSRQPTSLPNHWVRFQESVTDCPHQEAESALWCPPDVCPADVPLHGSIPSPPGLLIALGFCLYVKAFLLHSCDFVNHRDLLLPLGGFSPELLQGSPA